MQLASLKSLRDLLRPDRVETLLDYYWEKNGEKPSLYTIDLASKLLALAHSEDLTTVEIEGLDEIQNRPRAVPLYRSHREEPEADPPDRPQRRVAGGGAASAKADGRGPHQRQDEAVQGRRHGATRHRHSDPDSGAGADAEPRLDSHRHQSDQTRRPTADCRVWKQACVPAQRLRPGGAAARMKSSTRTSLVRAYGYLLEFCHRNGLLDQDAEAGAHVSPEIIDAFVNELHGRVGSVTRASYIGKIRRIATILAPGRDLVWLGEIEADLRYEARPRPKYHRIVSSERLLALGLELIRRGETSKHLTDLARARLVRDGLLIALLALCPIRLSNLSELRVGRQLRGIGDSWWIILEADETKTGRPDERPVPEILSGSIDRWLEHWRTVFLKPDDASWPSTKGGPLAYTYVGHIITETTRRELGVAVNPHLFRDCAVYTVATNAGDRMGIASGLLQHTDQRTVEKYYNKGASIGAVRRYQQILDQFMDD